MEPMGFEPVGFDSLGVPPPPPPPPPPTRKCVMRVEISHTFPDSLAVETELIYTALDYTNLLFAGSKTSLGSNPAVNQIPRKTSLGFPSTIFFVRVGDSTCGNREHAKKKKISLNINYSDR